MKQAMRMTRVIQVACVGLILAATILTVGIPARAQSKAQTKTEAKAAPKTPSPSKSTAAAQAQMLAANAPLAFEPNRGQAPANVQWLARGSRFVIGLTSDGAVLEFCDEGNQYRTAIFFHDAEQEREALESKAELDRTKPFKDPIVTEIVPASTFYPAEDHHQKYCRTHRVSYGIYKYNCGRDQRLRQLWGATSGGH